MKTLLALLVTLFAVNAYADKIDCTTRFYNVKTNQAPVQKICGAVSVDKALDNGVKYRKQPHQCEKFDVEFFSIREGDDSKFTTFCDEIFSKNCYMVRIHDNGRHQGIGGLSSHIVFSSIGAMPAIFNLSASGTGYHTGASVGVGRLVRMDLSCRKTK